MTPLEFSLAVFGVSVGAGVFGSLLGLGGGIIIVPSGKVQQQVHCAQQHVNFRLAQLELPLLGGIEAREVDLRGVGPRSSGKHKVGGFGIVVHRVFSILPGPERDEILSYNAGPAPGLPEQRGSTERGADKKAS